jgi:glutamyl-tRNA reductase
VRHLFRVVSAIDSMVLGETQILAQARSAYETAQSAGAAGPHLQGLFQRAFAAGKDAQSRTSIASGRLSVGSTAVDLARQIFSHFGDKTVMMVGAGEMGELALAHLIETNPKELWVTNRTDARAIEVAQRLHEKHRRPAKPVPYAEWIDRLTQVDIVITCTGAAQPILTLEQFSTIPARRRYRPILLIDIAVPRDIEPSIGELDEVFLYNIDDLQSVVEATLAGRRGAIVECQRIIEEHVLEYVAKQAQRDIGPLIGDLQNHFRSIGQSEWERIVPKLESLSLHDRALVEEMLHRLTQKLLHDPVQLLNDKSANGAASVYADTLRALFGLTKQS